jgi:hypothetical protein
MPSAVKPFGDPDRRDHADARADPGAGELAEGAAEEHQR